jgi:hypothetical protein
MYGPIWFPKRRKFSPVHARFNHYPSKKVSDTDAEQWESVTVNSRSGGGFSEPTDNVVGDVTPFARGGVPDKLRTVLVE